MKKLFGGMKMTWLKVIVFAIIVGMYSGAVMLIPFLKDTSFQDIGIYYEWWVVFAVVVVVNCDKWWDAMLKCFAFFLISQPIFYLTKIVFGSTTFEAAWHSYRQWWLPMTFLTLPGGLIAYFCKKQNVFGAIILALGNTIQLSMSLAYFILAIRDFPHHLLSVLFCVGSVIIMSMYIQHEKKNRLIAMLLPIALTLCILVWLKLDGRVLI